MTTQGHTVAPRGKRVQVVLHTGASFVAKLKGKEGGYHHFFDHDKVRSNKVNQLRILPTDVNPPSYRQEMKNMSIEKAKAQFLKGEITLPELRKCIKEVYPSAKIKVNLS